MYMKNINIYIFSIVLLLILKILSGGACADINKSITPTSSSSNHLSEDSTDKEYWLFVGNPGVGKSTIVNSLLQKKVALSGLCPGKGFTKCFAAYEDIPNKRTYIDTPGLAETDQARKELVAKEIEKALKQNAKYKIFFVVQLNEARVRAEDVATINTIMNIINLPHKPFSIIVNKLEFDEKDLLREEYEKAVVFDVLNSGVNKTQSIWFIDKSKDLKQRKIPFLKLDEDLYAFLKTREVLKINQAQVGKIETRNLETIQNAFQVDMNEAGEALKTDVAKQKKIINDLRMSMAAMQEEMAKEKSKK